MKKLRSEVLSFLLRLDLILTFIRLFVLRFFHGLFRSERDVHVLLFGWHA